MRVLPVSRSARPNSLVQSARVGFASKCLILGLALFGGLYGCNRSASTGQPHESARENDRAVQKPAPRRTPLGAPGVLVDLPEFRLTDQTQAEFGTTELRNQVWIGNFIFTRCRATCPVQTAKLAELQRQLQRWPDWDRVKLVSITVDPEHDTPEVLERYASTYSADSAHWKFLTGSREAIWKLSKEGFKLPVGDSPDEDDGPITHSPRFVLVDGQGRVRGFYDSQKDDEVSRLAVELRKVLEETPDPESQTTQLAIPADLFYVPWLDERRDRQLAAASALRVLHDFQMHDRRADSGITFLNHCVADCGRDWKMNHYDHGNGLAAADVDGDGAIDLFFLSQVGGSELWRNAGAGRFENITTRAGVAVAGRIAVSAAFADTDNDGDPDLFVTTTRHGNLLLRNDGKGNFDDVTADSGLVYVGHSSAGDFFDYDRDGLLDLFVSNVGKFTTDVVGYTGENPYYVGDPAAFAAHLDLKRSESSLLYHNEGDNHFRNVTTELGLDGLSWAGDATPLDANHDGWIDLYVLNMQGKDRYFENRQGRRFEPGTSRIFPRVPWGGMGVKASDFDNDGELELYVTNMHVDMWRRAEAAGNEKAKVSSANAAASYLNFEDPARMIFGNALFDADSRGVYQDGSEAKNAESLWPWGLSVGDLNADGWQDVFITSCMNFHYRYHPNGLLLNDRGARFVDAEFIVGVEPRANRQVAVPWFELDCSESAAPHPYCQGRTGRIVVWGAVGSRSSVICDLDRDGDLDIVTNDFNSAPQLLISNLSETRPTLSYLEVSLRGSRSNRDGLGARVTVTAGGLSQTQVHDGQSGYLSQSSLPLYFGLDAAATVEQIAVRWPSGHEQILAGPLTANRRLVIVEPVEAVHRADPAASPE